MRSPSLPPIPGLFALLAALSLLGQAASAQEASGAEGTVDTRALALDGSPIQVTLGAIEAVTTRSPPRAHHHGHDDHGHDDHGHDDHGHDDHGHDDHGHDDHGHDDAHEEDPTSDEGEVFELFPREQAVAAVYNQGRIVRVLGVGPRGSMAVHLQRTGQDVILDGTRLYERSEDGELRLGAYENLRAQQAAPPGEEVPDARVVLPEGHREPLRFVGRIGDVRHVAAGVRIYEGVQQVSVEGVVHRCARFSVRHLEGGLIGASARTRWVELESGVLVLEAVQRQPTEPWQAVLVLTGAEVVPSSVLGNHEALRRFVRDEVLCLGIVTFDAPADRGIVPNVPEASIDPARVPVAPETAPALAQVRQLVVRYDERGGRAEADALERAHRLLRLGRKKGVDFAEVVRVYSDGILRAQGGLLAPCTPEQAKGDPARSAAFHMGEGQVAGPFPARGGYVIVQRIPLQELAASRILIGHDEALRPVPQGRRRTRKQAFELLQRVRARVAAGMDFAQAAREFSETPEARAGGALGILPPGALTNAAMRALEALPVGGVTEVVDGVHGLMLLRRDPVIRVRARAIRVAWDEIGVRGVFRSRDEARAIALEALERLRQPGADLAEVVHELSDDPRRFENGGDTGLVDAYRLPPEMALLRDVEVGGTIGPVETARGFLVAVRTE